MKHIYTSLDIGSDSIKIAVCELYQNKLNLLAATSVKSKGIKRGLITDVDGAAESIKKAFNDISDMLGYTINKVIVSVPSYLAEYNIIKGAIDINNGIVTNNDVMKSLEKAINSKKIEGREMVTVLPVDFKLNNDISVKDPVGLKANSLFTRAVIVTVPKKNVYSVLMLLEKIGVEITDISINSIGDMYAFKNKNFEDRISSVINIGSETTSISVFNKSVIVKSSILSVGSKMIDETIANNYNVDIKVARNLKHKFVLASIKHARSSEFIECKNNNNDIVKINQYEISEIVESKVNEILNLAKNELNSLTSKRIDYIIITGGMSNMAAFEYACYDVFGENINIGSMKMIGVRDNKYSSAIGNIVYFISKLKLKGQNYTMIDDGDMASSGKSDNRSTPDSALGKIFGFFFND